jgi:acyl-CoA hydrolase/GNAT superfamily N-acetyltransferase
MDRWQDRHAAKLVDAATAVRHVSRGSHVFIGSGCAEPQCLVAALAARGEELADTEILHILTLGVAPYTASRFTGRFRHNAFFIGANVRDAVLEGHADYTPVFLSEVPRLFRTGRVRIDVALIQVSPPDRNGYCSFGVAVDVVKAGAESASLVIAAVNPYMPRTLGDSFIHVDQIGYLVESEEPILELVPAEPDRVAQQIGRFIADLIEPGATLQLGIGSIPNAVLSYLVDKEDLGLHTEMFTDGIIDLLDRGVITNRRKVLHPGTSITSFCMGTRRLYDLVDDNPAFGFYPSEYVNDPMVIGQNDLMVAINSALQIDLTGQVCADSIGHRFYSGIGGQVDFIRGAARSRGGKPIIALPSTAKNGTVSRIVPVLNEGAGIVTTRADVHYVVTEFGVADLYGRNVRERTLALVSIAHPDFRNQLLAAAKARRFVYAEQIPFPAEGAPYPKELERWVTLRDGLEMIFRPMKPTDERALRDLFYSHSEETVYMRYMTPVKQLSVRQIQEFVTLDYHTHLAIAAFLVHDDTEEMIAVARYLLDPTTNMAEVAFTVHDDYQNRGIGRFLLESMKKIAQSRGIAGFTAQVLTTNSRMLHLFHKVYSPLRSETSAGVYNISCRFAEIDQLQRQRGAEGPRSSMPSPHNQGGGG